LFGGDNDKIILRDAGVRFDSIEVKELAKQKGIEGDIWALWDHYQVVYTKASANRDQFTLEAD